MSDVLAVTTFGVLCCPSRIIFAGDFRSPAWAGPVPEGQPLLGGAGGGGGDVDAVTTAVGTEDENVLPSLFTASTLNRSVFPTSTCGSWYVSSWAPLRLQQLP